MKSAYSLMTEVFNVSSKSSRLGFLDLDPLKQRIVDRISENEIFVRIDFIASCIGCFFFSAYISLNRV